MSNRSYWLDLFSGTTWQEFLDSGADVSGFREGRWKTVQQMKPGDYLLCYLTGVSRWIGLLEVVSEPFKDDAQIWKDHIFPCRVHVKPIVRLTPETAVPIFELQDRLSIFQNLSSPFSWTGHLRGSPAKWKADDGEIIVRALRDAEHNPVVRTYDPAKLARKPPILKTKFGPVAVPEPDQPAQQRIVEMAVDKTGEQHSDSSMPELRKPQPSEQTVTPATQTSQSIEAPRETTLHTETQWLLLKLGNDMGLDVWVARNDRNRDVNGRRFSELARLKPSLPRQFDEVTNRIIELIDVLWLRGNAIVAAFEIECTTSIYSGLLRMSDLITMQPNLNIPLYIVAPDERREKVIAEVNRPTFSRLAPPMRQMCRFIPISTLIESVDRIAAFVRHMKPDFLAELSESCEVDEL